MRRWWLRFLAALLGALAASLAPVHADAPAAQPEREFRAFNVERAVAMSSVAYRQRIDAWGLSAWGSGHYLLTGGHFMVERFDANGWSNGHVVNHWFPWYCQVGPIHHGNAAGTALRIWIVPPLGYPYSCLSNGWSNYYGWSTNTGWAEGQNHALGWCVSQTTLQIPFRDPTRADAYGTQIAIC